MVRKILGVLSVGFFIFPLYAQASLTDGLVGYWTMNGADTNWGTNTLVDKSGTGNDGTLIGLPTSTTPVLGSLGQAFNFTTAGTGSYVGISLATGATFNALQTPMTISGWFYQPNTSGFRTIFGQYTSTTGHQLIKMIRIDNGVLRYYGSTALGAFQNFGTKTPTVGKWHFVTVTVDGSSSGPTVTIYLDNQTPESTTFTALSSTPALSTPVYLGANNSNITGEGFIGSLDDIRIYSRALSAAEVSQLYKLGQTKSGVTPNKVVAGGTATSLSTGLLGYWTFDGKDTNWVRGTMTDLSGTGNTINFRNQSTSTTPSIGVVGQSFDISGANTELTTTNNYGSTGIVPLTYSFWFKTDRRSGTKIIGLEDVQSGTGASSFDRSVYVGTDGKLYFGVFDTLARTITSIGTVDDNKWHYVAAILSGNNSGFSLYLDGVLQSSSSIGSVYASYSQTYLHVGAYSATASWPNSVAGYYKGSLDELRVYGRALSVTEIQRLYKMGQNKVAASSKVLATSTATGLSNGLVGYWTFDGKDTNWSTNTTSDLSGSGYTGTLTNMNTLSAPVIGKLGQALNFDGVAGWVNAASVPPSIFTNRTFTLAGWVKTSGGGAYLFTHSFCDGGWAVTLGGTLSVNFRGAGACGAVLGGRSSASSITDNKWHHVAIVITTDTSVVANNNITIYVDGVLNQGTQSISGAYASFGLSQLQIGTRFSGDSWYKGLLDDVRLYNRGLTAAEVIQLYKLGVYKNR